MLVECIYSVFDRFLSPQWNGYIELYCQKIIITSLSFNNLTCDIKKLIKDIVNWGDLKISQSGSIDSNGLVADIELLCV